MKKIVLDVDGVLLDYFKTFDKAASEYLNKKIVPKKNENNHEIYSLTKRIGVTEDVKQDILNYMVKKNMYSLIKPLVGVKDALEKIKKEGFYIYVVTAIHDDAKEQRLKNLKDFLNFVPDEIYCVGMGKSKKEIIEIINPDVFIDDRIDYLASVPSVYHLVWVDQKEEQHDQESMVDVHVHSLAEWVDKHMPRVVKKLNRFYDKNNPIQIDLKLENHIRVNKQKK